jgi:hypothetical protein
MAESEVTGLRVFLPAKEFETSYAFYQELGFVATRFGEGLALMQFGAYGFLLQHYDRPGFAENLMLQLVVKDLDAWWERVKALALETRYGVRPPSAPEMQPWGLRVQYLFDPTGVLWHVVQL